MTNTIKYGLKMSSVSTCPLSFTNLQQKRFLIVTYIFLNDKLKTTLKIEKLNLV